MPPNNKGARPEQVSPHEAVCLLARLNGIAPAVPCSMTDEEIENKLSQLTPACPSNATFVG